MEDSETAEKSNEAGSSDVQSFDYLEAVGVIWNRKHALLYIVMGITVVSIVVSLLLPVYYRSTVTILPESDKGKLANIGGISDLASLAGISVGGEASLVRLYPLIIKSESVLRGVIYSRYKTQKYADSVNLIQYWGLEDNVPGSAYFFAVKYLRANLEISMDKNNFIALSIETPDQGLSAAILNNLASGLDEYIRTKRISNASENRRFVEERLGEVKQDLEKAENALKEFRERNKQVSSPQLQLNEGRLVRDVQINSTLFIELKKQFELAKIEEVKNLPIINILDSATPAVFRERPKRTIMVIICFLLSWIVGVAILLADYRYRQSILDSMSRLRSKIKA